ncbi:MAG TPA: CPBP family intramembrane metalloprotease [Candidatus Stackebrandtia faecavium]|nr:CPBP family intramembrane metalloprotease [Candidatus Stackebrandtia faecavium]
MNIANTSDTTPETVQRDDSAAKPGPRWPTWARTLAPPLLMLPTVSVSMILYLIPGFGALAQRSDSLQLLAYAPLAAVALAAYVLVSWALVHWVDRRRFRDLGFRLDLRALLALLLGCVIALVVAVATAGFISIFGLGRPIDTSNADTQGSVSVLVVGIVVILLQAFVLQGIGEEVMFRGYLMQSLRRRPMLGIFITAIAFTVPHLMSSGGQQNWLDRIVYLALPLGFALSAGFLAVALRSVWAAIGIHGGFHLANFIVGTLGLLTADGPAVYLTFGVLHAVAAAAIALLIPGGRWAHVREFGPYGRE